MSAVANVKERYENYQAKKDCKQIDPYNLTYIDAKGDHRFRSDDHLVFTEFNRDMGTVKLIDMKNQRVVKEFVAPEIQRLRDQTIQRCESRGKTVVFEKTNLFDNCKLQYVYRDIYTQQKYVVRKIRDRYYYVSWQYGWESGAIIGETDNSKRLIKEGKGVRLEEMQRRISLQTCETAGFPEVSYDKLLCEKYS